ncbi:MAG: NAD(P)/FAD-dependent oxidoreductase, partial [Rhodobiaceae bacterium]|nr:NAD(P)/FAD-dependent oxidoreductase [Rhodobiaceae bacterium]
MTAGRPRAVIVGAGFAGLATARGLARAEVDITLIDRRNYHLFQPLLYQVATAALSPADIAWPIRGLLRGQKNATVVMGRVEDVDTDGRTVVLEDGSRYPYDHLVLATGARHTYFGHDDWEPVAPGLKKIDDATEIRRRILLAFEAAEAAMDMSRHRALLTFVVVGAGPTGVEMAGAIAELARRTLPADFRRIDTGSARVLLVEAGPRVLPSLPERLSQKAHAALERLGVEVSLGQAVTACGPDGIHLGTDFVPAATIVWAAGVKASPAGRWLGAETDRAGRVLVGPDLSVPGHPEILVLGDTAAATST